MYPLLNLRGLPNFYIFSDNVQETFTTPVEYNQQHIIRRLEGIPVSAFYDHISYRAHIYCEINGCVRGPFVSK